jgi:dephospho-CoA kinase
MTFVVGLTGGIGSGKSAAAKAFADLGAAIVDVDVISHELTRSGGSALPAIRTAFGDGVIDSDGALDRAAMRQLVFNDAAARARLEAILHPLIRAESDARCAAVSAAPYIILVVPLLIESAAYKDRVHRVAVVDCDEATQAARVVARSGMSPEQVSRIMAAQSPRAARLAAADDVIDNGNGLDALSRRIAVLDRKYRALAKQRRDFC